jgi:hypothetical protein
MTDDPKSRSEAPSQYLFPDLPDAPAQVQSSCLEEISNGLEELWFGFLFTDSGKPNQRLAMEFHVALGMITPHLRTMAIYVGFVLWLAKHWRVDRFRDLSVQQSLSLTDETARRLERMFWVFVRQGDFVPTRLIGADVAKLDAIAEELERIQNADGRQGSSEEWRDAVVAALPPELREKMF